MDMRADLGRGVWRAREAGTTVRSVGDNEADEEPFIRQAAIPCLEVGDPWQGLIGMRTKKSAAVRSTRTSL